MARLGDQFVSRVPAELNQQANTALGNADMYIAEYNIHMGKLRTDDGRQLFPDDMVPFSHWNLRDEIKSNYAEQGNRKRKAGDGLPGDGKDNQAGDCGKSYQRIRV